MAVAYLRHHIPGRLRIRVPAARGDLELLRQLSTAIASVPGISQVEYSPLTGSVLIQYSAQQHANLDSLHSALEAAAVPIVIRRVHPEIHQHHRRRSRRRSVAAQKVDEFFGALDRGIREATDDEVDLKFLMPVLVGGLGVLSLSGTSATPLWLTLMIFAFHSFLGLHAPSSQEMAAIERLGEELET